MKSQKELIWKGDWNVLIVLDACRFDFFTKIFKEYFGGELKKVRTSGNNTPRWLKKTFTQGKFEDTVYVSATPQINSLDSSEYSEINKRFHKVIDVWDWGWDEDLQTVPPEKVGRATRLVRAKYPKKRIISHFNQPHYPYLSMDDPDYGKTREGITGDMMKTIRDVSNLFGIYKWIHKIGDFLGITQNVGAGAVADNHGDGFLWEAYRENLHRAFREVKKTIKRLPDGEFIITADHGEMLGENNIYGHGYDFPEVRNVPWLEVEK